ncbi:MAG TPA: S41 family peptidase, partial [Kiritimatiellia bacterium]|nr:S41 family peptidase [Kiritimatiellia bacterium]
ERDLCEAVAEGARLLVENHLVPAGADAKSALLEALIRASEPSVVFLGEDELAARSRRLADREWDVGLTLVAAADSLPKVAAVRADSPAAAAGILPGELIEKVGGHEVSTGAALKLVRGWMLEGETAALEVGVRAADAKSRTVAVERVRRAESSLTDVEDLPAGMGYLRAAGIFEGAGAEISAALDQWRTAGKLGAILDLRGADGTAEAEIPAVAAKFVPVGATLYEMNDRQGNEIASVPAGPAPDKDLPLMVLVDEETCGAAELLAAVLGGSVQGAMVIGRETAGDPMIREPKPLSTGRYALLATRQLRTADGATYSGAGGVAPDVAIGDAALDETVYEPEAPVLRKGKTMSDEEKDDKALRDRTRNDTYLRRATDVLLGLKALGYDAQP